MEDTIRFWNHDGFSMCVQIGSRPETMYDPSNEAELQAWIVGCKTGGLLAGFTQPIDRIARDIYWRVKGSEDYPEPLPVGIVMELRHHPMYGFHSVEPTTWAEALALADRMERNLPEPIYRRIFECEMGAEAGIVAEYRQSILAKYTHLAPVSEAR